MYLDMLLIISSKNNTSITSHGNGMQRSETEYPRKSLLPLLSSAQQTAEESASKVHRQDVLVLKCFAHRHKYVSPMIGVMGGQGLMASPDTVKVQNEE
jgi:hypothetical protein